jgi:hypothetical protein
VIVEGGYRFYSIIFWVVTAFVGLLCVGLGFLAQQFKNNKLARLQWLVKTCRSV